MLAKLPPLRAEKLKLWGIYRLGRELVAFQLILAYQDHGDCAFNVELV